MNLLARHVIFRALLRWTAAVAVSYTHLTDFQCFWRIKWPAIMPTTLYILVITTINSFQCFALILSLIHISGTNDEKSFS